MGPGIPISQLPEITNYNLQIDGSEQVAFARDGVTYKSTLDNIGTFYAEDLGINFLASLSSGWQDTYNTVTSRSFFWDGAYSAVKASSGYWDSVYATVCSTSAYWDGDFCNETVYLSSVSACEGQMSIDGSIDMLGGNITNINTLCATEFHTVSSYTHYQDILISELSGFEVTGDVEVDGKVGIQVTDPDQSLHVSGNVRVDNGWIGLSGADSGYGFIVRDNTEGGIGFAGTTSDLLEFGGDGAQLYIKNDGTTVATGNVGIGTSSPQASLHVIGDSFLKGNATIGGNNYQIDQATFAGFVGGSFGSSITDAQGAVILGSPGSNITTSYDGIGILGGNNNNIVNSNTGAVIINSDASSISAVDNSNTIIGGINNNIVGAPRNISNSLILNGINSNIINTTGSNLNGIFVAGKNGSASHNGAYVFADSTTDAFESIGENTFNIQAAGLRLVDGNELAGRVLTCDNNGLGVWADAAGGDTSVTVLSSPPTDPGLGDLWYDSRSGELYIYYVDEGEIDGQWVDVNSTTPGNTNFCEETVILQAVSACGPTNTLSLSGNLDLNGGSLLGVGNNSIEFESGARISSTSNGRIELVQPAGTASMTLSSDVRVVGDLSIAAGANPNNQGFITQDGTENNDAGIGFLGNSSRYTLSGGDGADFYITDNGAAYVRSSLQIRNKAGADTSSVELNEVGRIELRNPTTSYIDFKAADANDYDARIVWYNDSRGLRFRTGGTGVADTSPGINLQISNAGNLIAGDNNSLYVLDGDQHLSTSFVTGRGIVGLSGRDNVVCGNDHLNNELYESLFTGLSCSDNTIYRSVVAAREIQNNEMFTSFICGAFHNNIQADRSIIGGTNNRLGDRSIDFGGGGNSIIAGSNNIALANNFLTTGNGNSALSGSVAGAMIAGEGHLIKNDAARAVIIGGRDCVIDDNHNNTVMIGCSGVTSTASDTVYVSNLHVTGTSNVSRPKYVALTGGTVSLSQSNLTAGTYTYTYTLSDFTSNDPDFHYSKITGLVIGHYTNSDQLPNEVRVNLPDGTETGLGRAAAYGGGTDHIENTGTDTIPINSDQQSFTAKLQIAQTMSSGSAATYTIRGAMILPGLPVT